MEGTYLPAADVYTGAGTKKIQISQGFTTDMVDVSLCCICVSLCCICVFSSACEYGACGVFAKNACEYGLCGVCQKNVCVYIVLIVCVSCPLL